MAQRLHNIKVNLIALVDKGANQLSDIVLFKRKKDAPETVTTGDGAQVLNLEKTMADEKQTPAENEVVAKELADARAELERVKKELADLSVVGSPDRVDLVKEEYAKTRADLEKSRDQLRKELETAQRELKESQEEVRKITSARRREKFIKTVQTMANLPGATADDFAEILDNIEAAIPEKQFNKLHTLLTSWDRVIAKSKIFEEIGRGGDGPAVFSGPEGRLHSLAKDLQTASGGKLTYAKAYDQAMRENPEIYQQYLKEQRGA